MVLRMGQSTSVEVLGQYQVLALTPHEKAQHMPQWPSQALRLHVFQGVGP